MLKRAAILIVVALIIGCTMAAAMDVGSSPACANWGINVTTESDCQPRYADGSPAMVTPPDHHAPWWVLPLVLAAVPLAGLVWWSFHTPPPDHEATPA